MRLPIALCLGLTLLWSAPARAEGEEAGVFDYYVLSLSWSPTWCALEGDARQSPQCDAEADFGWGLHGLWPQYHRGWPSYCRTTEAPPSRALTRVMADVMGTSGLAWYQWKKHGVCAGLPPQDYFALARRAFDQVAKPPVFRRLKKPVTLPAPLIEARMTAEAPVLRLELPPDFLHRARLDQNILLAPFMAELEAALAALDLAPRYAFGFDFARVADLSVGVLLAVEGDLKRREALSIEMRGVPGNEQKQIVGMILKQVRDRLVGAAFDATGMGWTVAEDMGRQFGFRETEEDAGLVWAIKFSEEWYRLHMPPLKAAFEDDMIALARDEPHLSDLRVVKMIRGVPRVPPTREGEKGKKRHGDFAIGLALAHFASRMRWVEYAYQPVPRATDRTPGQMSDLPDDRTSGRGWWNGPLGAGLRGGI